MARGRLTIIPVYLRACKNSECSAADTVRTGQCKSFSNGVCAGVEIHFLVLIDIFGTLFQSGCEIESRAEHSGWEQGVLFDFLIHCHFDFDIK